MREREYYLQMKRRAALAETLARRQEQQLAHHRVERRKAEDRVAQILALMPSPAPAHTVADLIGGASLRAMLEPARTAAVDRCDELARQIEDSRTKSARARARADHMQEKRDTARRVAARVADTRAADDSPSPRKPRPL